MLENKKTTCNCFFSKCFSGNIEAILENSGKNFWQKAENLALNVFEWFKVEYLFKKTYFHQNVSLGTENAFSTNMTKIFWRKAANIALSVIKTYKIQLPFKTLIFIKLFLWTLVCIRDNTDEKLLARGRNSFFLCPQIIESNWNFFREKTSFHSKCGSAHVEVRSDNLVNVLMPKCRKFIERLKCFGSNPKNDRKTDFYF